MQLIGQTNAMLHKQPEVKFRNYMYKKQGYVWGGIINNNQNGVYLKNNLYKFKSSSDLFTTCSEII